MPVPWPCEGPGADLTVEGQRKREITIVNPTEDSNYSGFLGLSEELAESVVNMIVCVCVCVCMGGGVEIHGHSWSSCNNTLKHEVEEIIGTGLIFI